MNLPEYLQSLTVTQGEGAGQPFNLLPWERRFCERGFAVSGDSALSIARGNGKSTLLAGIAAACIDGPLMQSRGEVVVCASSLAQARIIFEHALAFLRERGHDLAKRTRWKLADSVQQAVLEDRRTGARIRCIGSDPKRAHGLAPHLILADEPAQWPRNTGDAMIAALRTSLGKIPGSRLVALGTKPASEDHWFSAMMNGGADYSQVHAAPRDCDGAKLFHLRTWKRANPSLAAMPELHKRIKREAALAKRDPALLASFKALRLNMGTADTVEQVLLTAGTWKRVELGEGETLERRGPMVLAFDLGSSASMSASAAYWPLTGLLECFACFPQIPALGERGVSDGVGDMYERMAGRDELIVAGRRVSDVQALVCETVHRWGHAKVIVADRWREADLRQVLEQLRYPRCTLELRGMGFKDGAEDVRLFRRAVLDGRVRPPVSLLLRSAVGEARVVGDAAGNWKLSKTGEGGRMIRARDDAAAAAILAVSAGERGRKPERPTGGRRVHVC